MQQFHAVFAQQILAGGFRLFCQADPLAKVLNLTTYSQNAGLIGKTAATQLISLIEHPKTTLIDRVMIPGQLLEGDHNIMQYTNIDFTQDIEALSVTDFSNTYPYTVQAASDTSGVIKGVSF